MATDPLLTDLQVSATNQLVEALVRSENRMRQRLDLLSEVVFELDAHGHILFINRAWRLLMGESHAGIEGHGFDKYLVPEDRSVLQMALQSAGATPAARGTVLRFVHDSGAVLWMELSLVRIEGGHVGALHDITHQRRIQEQLEFMAHYDVLTKMPNRVLLTDRIEQAMARCQRSDRSLAVAFLDLDGFKAVNDHHGHDAGDQLLTAVARRLRMALRDGDSIARIGGDEFVALLVDLEHVQQAAPVLQRLLLAAAEPVLLGDLTLQVSASIGVTLYPQDPVDADQLIRHADQAMYVAKQGGKNRYHFFDVARDSAVRAHGETLDQITRALGRQEFELFYQPKVNMRSGTVFGAEALIRWRHPNHGLLAPGTFLPSVQNHPVSVLVGEWVIRSALMQLAEWARAGMTLHVSVNVEAYHLLHEAFVPTLRDLLAEFPDLDPGRLTLEILETSDLGDMDHVVRVMRECLLLGVAFALDDFGTGYSSLTYLKHLPAETVKIDRSFVHGMLVSRDDLAIVTGVIGLARAFGRRVIAEGVETPAHMRRLLHVGCDFAQGFGIAHPMPAPELPHWIAQWQPPQHIGEPRHEF